MRLSRWPVSRRSNASPFHTCMTSRNRWRRRIRQSVRRISFCSIAIGGLRIVDSSMAAGPGTTFRSPVRICAQLPRHCCAESPCPRSRHRAWDAASNGNPARSRIGYREAGASSWLSGKDFAALCVSLGAEWSGKRCTQGLKVSRREGYGKRHSVFPDVRWRAGFGNCDNAPTANHPGQRDRGGRAPMDSTDLRQRAVTYYKVMVPAERRVRHHRHVVLLAPQQNGRLNVTVVETVRDLIGCAAMAVWNTEQIFHLAAVE